MRRERRKYNILKYNFKNKIEYKISVNKAEDRGNL